MRLAVPVMLMLAGCECTDRTRSATGSANWREDDGVVVDGDDDATIAFGPIPFGTSAERTASIENPGRAAVVLSTPSGAGIFSWAAIEQAVLAPSTEQPLRVVFTPSDNGGVSAAFEQTISISVAGTEVPRTLRLHISGEGYGARCALPESLDFGTVRVGGSAKRSVTFQNATVATATVTTRPLEPGFSWDTPSLELEPHSEGDLGITFSPTEPRTFSAVAVARASADCPWMSIRLTGLAVSELLEWEPTTIDCGWVPLGVEVSRNVTFRNLGSNTTRVTDFSTTGPATTTSTALELVAGGEGTHPVSCRTTTLGPQVAQLRFSTSAPGLPEGSVTVVMKGGGPRISATPVLLSYGRVASLSATTRRLLIRNVGAVAADAGADANLHLETDDAGVPIIRFESDGGLSANDVQIQVGPYNAQEGLRAIAGDILSVDVRLIPPSVGDQSFLLHLRSNDPLNPELQVPATAAVVALPPCNLSIQPTTLPFGILIEGEAATRSVVLHNDGVHDCLVSAVDIDSAGRSQGFELVGGRIESLVLQQATSMTLNVRSSGQSVVGPKAGRLNLEISEPSTPLRSVTLSSFSAAPCFAVSPTPLAFGPTPIGCSRTRAASIYNLCSTPLSFLGAQVQSPGFSVDGGSGRTLAVGESESISVTMSPASPGPLEGELALNFGQALRLHPMTGEGIPASQVTESFVQPAVPTIDVLLSVSTLGGGSWGASSDGGNALNEPLRARIAGAVDALGDAGIDFHFGVISGHWDRETWESPTAGPPWVFGELVGPSDAGTRFATPSPTASAFVDAAVVEATRHLFNAQSQEGACFEAATRAITAPLLGGINRGFRRPGVSLAVICETFLGDLSTIWRVDSFNDPPTPWTTPLPVNYYWNRLSVAAGGASLLTVNGLAEVSGPPDCPDPASDTMNRLRDMALLSGGSVIDLCEPDLNNSIQALRQSLLVSNRRFTLAGTAEASAPIVVRINGVTLAPSEWQYDEQLRMVTTLDSPQPGAVVQVTYLPACGG